MRVALELAKRGLGQTAPNPSVGCVIVQNGIVVGRGWTRSGGRPHAETIALKQAGALAAGATVYVTLEPCAHTGATPPCADALVDAGVSRVVISVGDPDKRVSGRGIQKLRDVGIKTTIGVLENEAARINRGFFLKATKGRPLFTLKLATTIDGKIALGSGESKWITGKEARAYGHGMRARHDAIMVGVGTMLADDPALTCRIPGLEARSPVRVILDSKLRTPPTATALKKSGKTIIVTSRGLNSSRYNTEAVEIIELDDPHQPGLVAKSLGDRGITSVLIEGGARVSASFIKAGLVDRIVAFNAGKLIGSDGLGAVDELNLASLADAPHFTLSGIRQLGPDMLASYEKAE